MYTASASENYFHKLDALPDERQRRRRHTAGVFLTNPVAGEIVDISAEGIGVECSRPLRVHASYPLTLASDNWPRTHKQGEVRWCRLVSTGITEHGEPRLVYRVGISFLDP